MARKRVSRYAAAYLLADGRTSVYYCGSATCPVQAGARFRFYLGGPDGAGPEDFAGEVRCAGCREVVMVGTADSPEVPPPPRTPAPPGAVRVRIPRGKPSPVGKVIPGFGVERQIAPGVTEVTLEPGVMEQMAARIRADDAAPLEVFEVEHDGAFEWKKGSRRGSAAITLHVIRMAWHAGLDVEEDADGFGPGAGTHGDWSAIRDSSKEARARMFGKALDFIESRLKRGTR